MLTFLRKRLFFIAEMQLSKNSGGILKEIHISCNTLYVQFPNEKYQIRNAAYCLVKGLLLFSLFSEAKMTKSTTFEEEI